MAEAPAPIPFPLPPEAPGHERLASAKYRWLVGIAVALTQSAVYFGIGHTELNRSTELLRTRLDDAIPFWTWTAWCYLPLYGSVFVMSIAGFRRRALFDRTARSILIIMFIGALCHIFIRAEYPRPLVLPPFHGLSDRFMAWVQHVDSPGNVFPSLHVAHTTMLALLLVRDRPVLGRAALVMATLLALSTLTTKQHFIADVISGYLLAFLGVHLAVRGLTPGPRKAKRQAETT
jgi:membrane-associated phospholipid phosphatase